MEMNISRRRKKKKYSKFVHRSSHLFQQPIYQYFFAFNHILLLIYLTFSILLLNSIQTATINLHKMKTMLEEGEEKDAKKPLWSENHNTKG
jgi:hypothetical protein